MVDDPKRDVLVPILVALRAAPARSQLRELADGVDISSHLAAAQEMAESLERIARREELRNPGAAIRAGQAAARIRSDVVAGVLLQEDLAILREQVAALGANRNMRVLDANSDPGNNDPGDNDEDVPLEDRSPKWLRSKGGTQDEKAVSQERGRGELEGEADAFGISPATFSAAPTDKH